MLASKVTTKYQTTIPLEVREKLGIQQGDMVAFELENGVVRLRRVVPLDVEYAKALAGTLSEWASENDEEAYRGL
ncbi:MAG: AbrB/MazE/SpoVT family DNA-binding domain-containing protein [Sulfuricella sp.]|jgi:AbrB family looped-hinge helix DNA binding protein|uniref:AbrB/MazE/SpoVT family DNA-binding domain-containing protein n=1 Tax=Sulfuricella sp. T08 TaxID=1632857 RepID=UPI000617A0C2|nr:AbrB/MazE/SpoVT family DNA-binding domain-containing protein [Sulfuricella sp. T08]MDO9064777.1 AbrB/MazE/SpoVT family DNA-binding domain-containing protein [Sulfuricella sp.]MDP2878384.1 AbrB/MazE/SpoVT family DNA-binding domain-containing protein [Sulfuricella sp.]MDP3482148.1 AbrB/MazE/SpoVT family DNA-binding domain-containing protein [Sulfuricella sp.]GAO34692.1 AbrB family transcriptional regulator [Sulfuricella sp. T08]